MIELLSTYTEENASTARNDALKCIVSTLADPNTFLMDNLLTLKPVKYLEGEPIHNLLTIFVSEKLNGYLSYYNKNKSFIVDQLSKSYSHLFILILSKPSLFIIQNYLMTKIFKRCDSLLSCRWRRAKKRLLFRTSKQNYN